MIKRYQKFISQFEKHWSSTKSGNHLDPHRQSPKTTSGVTTSRVRSAIKNCRWRSVGQMMMGRMGQWWTLQKSVSYYINLYYNPITSKTLKRTYMSKPKNELSVFIDSMWRSDATFTDTNCSFFSHWSCSFLLIAADPRLLSDWPAVGLGLV